MDIIIAEVGSPLSLSVSEGCSHLQMRRITQEHTLSLSQLKKCLITCLLPRPHQEGQQRPGFLAETALEYAEALITVLAMPAKARERARGEGCPLLWRLLRPLVQQSQTRPAGSQ